MSEADEIFKNLEAELRANWGWDFNTWISSKGKKTLIRIYSKTNSTVFDSSTMLLNAKNLYYSLESYVYFSDSRSDQFMIKDLLVFLERIIKNQFN